MITNRQDLKYFLSEDLKRYNNEKPNIKDWILKNEKWYIWQYIKTLRHLEFHLNNKNKLRYLYWFFKYKRMCYDLKIDIKPNNLEIGRAHV